MENKTNNSQLVHTININSKLKTFEAENVPFEEVTFFLIF